MHAKDFFVNNSSNGETIETVCECFPQLNVVPSLALVIKSIDSIDGSTLVISSQEEKVLWVFNLVSQEKAYSFETLLSSVDIVSQEEIVSIRGESSILKQSQ